ncbi:hypothetical protein Ahy_A09g043662 [Arachis hypogaea]|uniref:ZF-HD dimerization-type domain-containing protein n=1 Tax=Arachis hypogaea TaxID=3818 RepID=A0A445BIU0_ARAHY|nr:hypothetical protein Ahy_A09g043662 [Arachis hypogaea]
MEPNNYNSSSNVVVTDDVKKPLLEEKKMGTIIRYKECLKNHAASLGGNATDGCGEFMPCGQQGTIEALICSACNCHRNFHRKEIQSEAHHHKHQVVKHIFAHTSMSLSDQSYDHDHNDNKDYCEKGVLRKCPGFHRIDHCIAASAVRRARHYSPVAPPANLRHSHPRCCLSHPRRSRLAYPRPSPHLHHRSLHLVNPLRSAGALRNQFPSPQGALC